MLSLRLQRRSFSSVGDKIQALWMQKTGYLSKHGDGYRNPSPGYAFIGTARMQKIARVFNFLRRFANELTRL